MSKVAAILGLAVLAGGAALLARSSTTPATSPPSVTGLVVGAAYRVIVRSSLSRDTFGSNAAGQQAQALLGRQGFNVTAWLPNANGDPYVYDVFGTYQGTSGALADDANGVTVLGAIEVASSDLPIPPLEYVSSRPLVTLEPGTIYAGRASLPWPVTLIVSTADVKAHLEQQGFVNVIAYTDAEDLPSDWPASERGGDVFAIATYPITANEKTMSVPSQVRSIWKAGTA